MGAITGIYPPSTSILITLVSIEATSPTCPISIISGADISGVLCETTSFLALISWPSLPVTPKARPPAALIILTISLLTVAPRTISTTSMVLLSVTRIPSINFDSIDRRSSSSPICGPPPWTTTGLIPTAFISTISRAKLNCSLSSPMALPPYLTTTVLPEKRWI